MNAEFKHLLIIGKNALSMVVKMWKNSFVAENLLYPVLLFWYLALDGACNPKTLTWCQPWLGLVPSAGSPD